MKNQKLKGLFAKAKIEAKNDSDFENLNDEFIASIKGGIGGTLASWDPGCNLNYSCNNGCGKKIGTTTT
jgi:hypothetical protein